MNPKALHVLEYLSLAPWRCNSPERSKPDPESVTPILRKLLDTSILTCISPFGSFLVHAQMHSVQVLTKQTAPFVSPHHPISY